MKKHSFKEWLVAVRPWSFPASAMPVLVTLAYLHWGHGSVDWLNGLWALVNIVLFHASGNTWSDYYDYRRGVDAADTFGVKTLTGGMFRPAEIYRLSVVLLAVALLGGLGLLLLTGWPLLVIGACGLLLSLAYPWLKYHALGDLDIFLTYAVLPTVGTSYVAVGYIDWHILWIAVPVGLITVAILHINNTRDISTDTRVHIRTLAMLLGCRISLMLYRLEIVVPFLWLLGCVVGGVLPVWSVLVCVALFPAIGNVRSSLQYPGLGIQAIAGLDELTAKLQLVFSVLLALSLFLAGWFS